MEIRLETAILESTGQYLHIDPNRRVFTLRILPNDNPHGTIQFALDNFVLEELDADATQYVTVSRLYVTNVFFNIE